jgi:hypothetical protein
MDLWEIAVLDQHAHNLMRPEAFARAALCGGL